MIKKLRDFFTKQLKFVFLSTGFSLDEESSLSKASRQMIIKQDLLPMLKSTSKLNPQHTPKQTYFKIIHDLSPLHIQNQVTVTRRKCRRKFFHNLFQILYKRNLIHVLSPDSTLSKNNSSSLDPFVLGPCWSVTLLPHVGS